MSAGHMEGDQGPMSEPECTTPEACGICHECQRPGHFSDDCPEHATLRAEQRERERIMREVVGPLGEAVEAAVSILGVAINANVTGAHTIRERLRAALATAREQTARDGR